MENTMSSLFSSARAQISKLQNMYQARMDICTPCPNFQAKSMAGTDYSVCGACGCVLQAKARIAQANCPEGRWPVEGKDPVVAEAQ